MLTQQDLDLLKKKGISEEKLHSQLESFKTGFPFLKLAGAASPKHGITIPTEREKKSYLKAWETYLAGEGKVLKFVPASGAASRMFKNLFEFLDGASDTPDNDFIKKFFSQIHNFAFFDELDAACQKNEGKSIDEIAEWVTKARHKIHHEFFSTDLKYFRKSGRMSGATATVAAILNICPIMHLDAAGKIIAYDKVRGKRNAINFIMDKIKTHADGGENYSGKVFICHSNTIEDATDTKNAIEERFKNINGEVQIYNIGTIIASHTGPGTVAVFFFGDERTEVGV